MDLSTLEFAFTNPTKPADVPGGCAGAPEPIRGCDRACAPAKVLARVHWRTPSPRPRARRRAGTDARRVRLHAGVKLCGGHAFLCFVLAPVMRLFAVSTARPINAFGATR
jgi:hypothetical protein